MKNYTFHQWIRNRVIGSIIMVVCALALLGIDLAVDILVFKDSLCSLIIDHLLPIVLVAAVCMGIGNWGDPSLNFLFSQLPSAPVTAVSAPLLAAFMGTLSYLTEGSIRLPVCAAVCMTMAPFIFKKGVGKQCLVLMAQTIFFVLIALYWQNAADALTIFLAGVAAMVYLLAISDPYEEEFMKQEVTVSVLGLLFAAGTLFFTPATGMAELFLFGHTSDGGLLELIMDLTGLWSAIPVALLTAGLVIGGFISAGRCPMHVGMFLVVFSVLIGSSALCSGLGLVGWSAVRSPFPLLGGNFYSNTAFLFVAIRALPLGYWMKGGSKR